MARALSQHPWLTGAAIVVVGLFIGLGLSFGGDYGQMMGVLSAGASSQAPATTVPKGEGKRGKGKKGKRKGRKGRKGKGKGKKGKGKRAKLTVAAPGSTEVEDMLDALGYTDGDVAATSQTGVLRYDPARVAPGLNFFTSGHGEAVLMRSDGEVLHRWAKPLGEVVDTSMMSAKRANRDMWRRARLLPGGDIIAIYEGIAMVRLDRHSGVRWAVKNRAHHDLRIEPDGNLLALKRKANLHPTMSALKPVLEDYVVRIDVTTGEELGEWSVLQSLWASPFSDQVTIRKRSGDVFHTNSVMRLLGTTHDPALAAGRVLVSMRQLDTLAVIDLDTGRWTWMQRGSYRKQHDPRELANGHLLLFDNSGLGGRARVLELDTKGSTIWSYVGEGDGFRSPTRGAAQRLPNGNTLITASDTGLAFEVTSDGTVVWRFVNPDRARSDPNKTASLSEVWRLPVDTDVSWLDD